jgi:hypothetical protein
VSRHLFVLIFEPRPGAEAQVDALLRAARVRAEGAGWHCWAYRNEIAANEITLFLEGPRRAGDEQRAVFGTEIQELRQHTARFEPVRSLTEYPLEEATT